MIRFWRLLIGMLWGAAVGVFGAYFFGKAFHNDAIICGMACGFPVLFGLYGGLRNNRWKGFWKIILCPFSALHLVAFIVCFLAAIVTNYYNIWHCVWTGPSVVALMFSTEKVIVFCFKDL